MQGVYNVITGLYPTNKEEAASLGALQFQAKFGNHQPEVYGLHVTRVTS